MWPEMTEDAAPGADPAPRAGLARAERLILPLLGVWIAVLHFVQWPILLANSYGDRDSAVYALAGELLRQGGEPYLSYWDHKPPVIHLLNGAALAVSDGHGWGIWLLSLLVLFASLIVGYATLRRCFGPAGTVVGSVLFATSLVFVLQGGNLTEQYGLPLQWSMVLLLVGWRPERGDHLVRGLALGALGALGFLLRPNLVGTLVAVAVAFTVVLLSRRRARAWLTLGGSALVGFAALLALTWAYLALEGSLEAAQDQIFRYNFLYSATGWGERVRTAFYGLQTASGFTFVLAAAGWVLALTRMARPLRPSTWSPALVLALIWLPLELPLAAMSGRNYPHYFMAVLPPLAWLTALAADELVGKGRMGMAGVRAAPLWALVLGVAFLPGVRVAQLAALTLRDEPSQVRAVGAFVRSHSRPEESIFVWGGEPSLYLLSDRKPASRFIYAYPLLTRRYADAALVDTLMHDLEGAGPALVVDASPVSGIPSLTDWDPAWIGAFGAYHLPPQLREFYDWMAEHYEVAAKVGPDGWIVYRRKGLSLAAPGGDVEGRRISPLGRHE